jgi:Delta24(24(1))-sterol reductase
MGRRRSRKSGVASLKGDDSDAHDSSTGVEDEVLPIAPSTIKRRRKSNRFANGGENITTNGHANGHTDANGHAELDNKVIDGWRKGMDPKVDYSNQFEFGGSAGVTAMMIGFPLLMYYMWIGATYYDGKAPWPRSTESWSDFANGLGRMVYNGAYPSLKAWTMYWTFLLFEGACYCLMPGIWTKGKPLPHENGRRLDYYCSAMWSWWTTIALALGLHFSGIFKLYQIVDEFGPIMSVAIVSGFIVSIIAYASAIYRGKQHRMTGHLLYDFFMGAELNPRMFGVLDLKMFFEVRLPWYILFLTTLGTAARQYERYGYVSGEVGLLLLAHFLYANACSKGEECIVPTWDMYYEKWGFMLIFWNLAGVPLSYCHCTLYLANHDPSTHSWNKYALGVLYLAYLFVYWVWDTTNSQKNRFRARESGNADVKRKAFPQLPWQTVENPKVIVTQDGHTILADGWCKSLLPIVKAP